MADLAGLSLQFIWFTVRQNIRDTYASEMGNIGIEFTICNS